MVLGLYDDNASGFVRRRRQRRLLRKYDMQRLADSAPVRSAHAHSHYPVGCDLGTTWSRLVGLGFETTRGGLLRKYDVQRLPREYGVWRLIGFGSVGLGSAPSQGARLAADDNGYAPNSAPIR